MAERTRLLVVDDHALVRDMLRGRLNQEPDLDVVAAAANGDEALRLAEELSPDLVVLDIDMPGLSAFEAARRIQQQLPRTRILFLSAYIQDGYISQVLQVRACAYATKGNPPEILIDCIRKVARGAPKKAIARALGVSVKTVDQHCLHIMQKLDIHDRVELARFAVREGLIEP